jgi:hypothetical protein
MVESMAELCRTKVELQLMKMNTHSEVTPYSINGNHGCRS